MSPAVEIHLDLPPHKDALLAHLRSQFTELATVFTGTLCKYSAIMTEWEELEHDQGPHPNF